MCFVLGCVRKGAWPFVFCCLPRERPLILLVEKVRNPPMVSNNHVRFGLGAAISTNTSKCISPTSPKTSPKYLREPALNIPSCPQGQTRHKPHHQMQRAAKRGPFLWLFLLRRHRAGVVGMGRPIGVIALHHFASARINRAGGHRLHGDAILDRADFHT